MKNDSFFTIGEKYFVRTVTMHTIGELIGVNDSELLFKNAAWVADSGRFYDALKNGTLYEVEPFIDDVIVNRGSIVDATKWKHELPIAQK